MNRETPEKLSLAAPNTCSCILLIYPRQCSNTAAAGPLIGGPRAKDKEGNNAISDLFDLENIVAGALEA